MTSSDRHPLKHTRHVQLGDDELRAVLDFAVDDIIDHKFALAQVSSHWRAISTSTSAFWSSFTVRSLPDAARLHTVIMHTGTALLDVSLDFTLRKGTTHTDERVPVFSEYDRSKVYSTLGPHAKRLRTLALDLGNLDYPHVWCSESLSPLFVIPSPRMEELSLAWRPDEWLPKGNTLFTQRATEPIVVPLHPTPRLRKLHLENMVPVKWLSVAPRTLETFDVRSATQDPFLLSGILYRCPLVSSLTIIPKGPRSAPFSNAGVPPISVANLRSVHIGSPFLNIWAVLSASVDMALVHDVTVTIIGDEPGVTTGLLYEKLLQRFGPITECSLVRSDPGLDPTRPGYDVYNVIDSSGRCRRVFVSCSRNYFIPAFWEALLTCPSGMDELRHLTVTHFPWFATSFFLIRRSVCVPITDLRIILPDSTRGVTQLINFLNVKNAYPKIFDYPHLTRLKFECAGDSDACIPIILDVLNSIAHNHQAQPVEVCVPPMRNIADWFALLTPKLECLERWTTCTHCRVVNQPRIRGDDSQSSDFLV